MATNFNPAAAATAAPAGTVDPNYVMTASPAGSHASGGKGGAIRLNNFHFSNQGAVGSQMNDHNGLYQSSVASPASAISMTSPGSVSNFQLKLDEDEHDVTYAT